MSGESVAINDAGNLVIVGASNNSGPNGAASYHARVYSEWISMDQRGSDLDGEAASDGFGDSAAINSDGNIVAVGSQSNGASNRGHVRVFEWSSNSWSQKGQDIDGTSANQKIGANISISNDGNTIAAAGEGIVKVYSYNGTSWIQKGITLGISGQGSEMHKVSMSGSGDIVAFVADSGLALVYKWNGSSWALRKVLVQEAQYIMMVFHLIVMVQNLFFRIQDIIQIRELLIFMNGMGSHITSLMIQ